MEINKFPNVFINNAAVTGEWLMKEGKDFPDLKDTLLSDWNSTINANLTGQFLISREIDRYLNKIQHHISLINISTMYALRGPHHNIYNDRPVKSFCAYSASKAGVIGLSRMAKADEISKVIEFLASENSSYITGEIINVDGGFSAW